MPLTISKGEIHKYLGMVFDFNTANKVITTMYQYIDGVIEVAPDTYKTSSREAGVGMAIPAPSNLYDIHYPRDKGVTGVRSLTETEREEYHTLMAQCIYLSKDMVCKH